MDELDLVLNKLQGLICHKTVPNQNITYYMYLFKEDLTLKKRSFVNMSKNPTKPNPIYLIYMYKQDLALNNQQWLICHKTQSYQIIHI